MPSSFVRRTPSSTPKLPIGTLSSPSAPSLPILSTGIPSLDDILGGGLPIGSLFSLLTPDDQSAWSKLVARYWIAQGLASGHDVLVVGGGGGDGDGLDEDSNEEGRDLVKGCMWLEESAITKQMGSSGQGGNEQGQEDPDSDAEGLELDGGNRTRIAWRYEKMKKFQTTVSGGRNQASSSFSHTLNLTSPLSSTLRTHLEQSGQITYLPLTQSSSSSFSSSSSSSSPSPHSVFQNTLLKIQTILAERGVLNDRLPGSASPVTGKNQNEKVKEKKVMRIVVNDLGSITWGDSVSAQHIHRFLHSLRSLIRHSSASVLITYPPQLARSPPTPYIPSSSLKGKNPSTPSSTEWIRSITLASDTCIEFQGFANDPALSFSFPLSHGLIHVHSLPSLHTLLPPAFKHSTLLGLGQGSSGQNNLAFKLKRKRFVIETLHLGVEGGVGESRTEPSVTGGAIDATSRKSHSHDEHDHHGHHHHHESPQGPGATQSIEMDNEGIDVPQSSKKKGVSFSSIEIDDGAGQGVRGGMQQQETNEEEEEEEEKPVQLQLGGGKKERRKVVFARHDKPELYEF